jgi:hypothetical protein
MQQQMRRSRLIIGILSLGLLAGVALTAGPAPAAEGIGPAFPERAWNRKLPVATRFLVQTDWASEAVLDKETSLLWERAPQGAGPWVNALLYCTNKTTGGRKGWRLPSVHELASLVDPFVTPGPTLPPGHPFINVQSAGYWSATTRADLPTFAWLVFFDGGPVGTGNKSVTFHAWCVRGGMNGDAY